MGKGIEPDINFSITAGVKPYIRYGGNLRYLYILQNVSAALSIFTLRSTTANSLFSGLSTQQKDAMIKIIGITGSLRSGSFNTALLRVAAGLMPSGAMLETATLKGIPLYDGDIEANEGIPQAVIALQEQIAAADGLLLATPEYNNSMPGVFKNAIDWLSRPPSDIGRVFGGRPVAVMGASPGGW